MKIRSLTIAGAWELTPDLHGTDDRLFYEISRLNALTQLDWWTEIAQVSCSVSAAGVLRGIHYGQQRKVVTCVRGSALDVVVDLRAGSPTFGQWDSVTLDGETRRSVCIGAGIGHGFLSLADDTTLVYLASSAYDPAAERQINQLDSDLAIDWPWPHPTLSDRDRNAPTLAEALAAGLMTA